MDSLQLKKLSIGIQRLFILVELNYNTNCLGQQEGSSGRHI